MKRFSLVSLALAGILAVILTGCASSAPPNEQASTPRDAGTPHDTVITSPAKPVETAPNQTAKAPTAKAANAVTIELPGGYKSGAATVRAGQLTQITFVLKEDAGCGNDVVVPEAKWRKTLKVGQRASLQYTPKKSGTLKFACSMDMYKGSIIVK